MSLPAIEKSWQIVPNMTQRNTGPLLILDRKNALCGTAFGGYSIALNAWHVVRSSNGVTVADSDLWVTTSDIVLGANVSATRSWIILENALGRQILIDYYGAVSREFQISLSPGGLFTGGTISTKPTASDELNTYGFASSIGVSGNCNQHIWVSADGRQTIMVTCASSSAVAMWIVGEAEDAPASWANPCVMYNGTCGDTVAPTSAWGREVVGYSAAHPVTGEATPGVNATIRMVTECVDVTPVTAATNSPVNMQNEVSGQWDWIDCSLFESEHASLYGVIGRWPDIYATATPRVGPPSLRTGDHYPSDGSRLWVQVDDRVLPWQGAPAMVVG
jgi:hypothetical protein